MDQKAALTSAQSNAIGPKKEKRLDFMKFVPSKKVMKFRFDFEIGYLIKSPCKECQGDNNLPECADDCAVLDKVHTILAESISCTRRF